MYKIDRDGFVEVVRKFEKEMIYAVTAAPDGGILLSTGPQGRLYRFKDGEVSLLAAVPEKQVVSLSNGGGDTLITTTNSGAVYRMDGSPSTKAESNTAASAATDRRAEIRARLRRNHRER